MKIILNGRRRISNEEEDIDVKINKIIQEEIVLNKTDYDNKMKNARKLGATQYKLNNKLSNAQKKLIQQTQKYIKFRR